MLKKWWRATFPVWSMLLLLTTLITVYPSAAKRPATVHATATQQADETRSVSGIIASVGRNSFTLTLTSAFSRPDGQYFHQDSPKSRTFLVDKDTTIDGKLRVGASADVTYRQSNGNSVAINVRVAS